MAKSMGSKAGLTRKKVQVRLKSGKTIQRSMMVRAGDAVKGAAKRVGAFASKHRNKIAGAAVLATAAYALHKGVKARAKHEDLAKGWQNLRNNPNASRGGSAVPKTSPHDAVAAAKAARANVSQGIHEQEQRVYRVKSAHNSRNKAN